MDMPLNRGGVTVHRQQKLKRSGDLDFSGGDIAEACRDLQRSFTATLVTLTRNLGVKFLRLKTLLNFVAAL